MQASTMGGAKLEKRYSPSFRDDTSTSRKSSAPKRKRDDALRLVPTKHDTQPTNPCSRMHTHYTNQKRTPCGANSRKILSNTDRSMSDY